MLIDFDDLEPVTIQRMNGGEGAVFARLSATERTRVIVTRMPPGSSIGMHVQSSGDDVNYVLEGKGTAVCDGRKERLEPGVCHVCPMGGEHSIMNDGDTDLVLLTVVPIPRG